LLILGGASAAAAIETDVTIRFIVLVLAGVVLGISVFSNTPRRAEMVALVRTVRSNSI
jgi:hypothetical protein